METTKSLLQYDTYDESTGTASVIIVAAGSSTRMGGVSKQLLSVGGIPVIARTLLAFQRAACIKNIVLVARECDILDLQKIAEKYMITKLAVTVSNNENILHTVKYLCRTCMFYVLCTKTTVCYAKHICHTVVS